MIAYAESVHAIGPEMLDGFFEGWKKPHSPQDHLRILQNSDHVVLAIDTDASRVVGYITALTDGLHSAFISLLEVLPGYRRHGIGSMLVRKMLDKLNGIQTIDLMCDPGMQGFYAQFGMQPSVGMAIRRY